MFTDIVGYTKLMQKSESEAIKLRNRHREVFESLAVLPFDNFTGEEYQDFMVDGIHDNLITAVSRSVHLGLSQRHRH